MRSWKDYKFSDYVLKKLGSKDQEFNQELEYYKFGKEDISDNVNDLFHSLFSSNPKKAENGDPFFQKYIEIISETKDFQNLKHKTEKNNALSFIATKDMMRKMYEEYVKYAENAEGETPEEKAENIQKKMDENKSAIRQKSREIVQEAIEKVEDGEMVEALISGCGNDPSTNQKFEDTEKIMNYAAELKKNKWFREIVKLAGSMQRSSRSTLMKKIPNIGTPIGVDFGKDLKNVLPQELAMLSMGGDFEDLFWKKWADCSLLQYKTEMEQPQESGPIIVCLDQSGSMDWRRAESVAFCFGMFLVAKETKRDFHVICFDDTMVSYEVDSIEVLMKIANTFLGGGTDFEKPLNEAVEIIESDPKFKKADIMFITDGCAPVSDVLVKRIADKKNAIQFKIIGMNFGGAYYNGTLMKFCDVVFDANDKQKFYEKAFDC